MEEGYLVAPPQISQIGVSDSNTMDDFLISISLKIESLIDGNMLSISKSDDDIIDKIKKIIRSEFKLTFLKRPVVSVHISRVK